jgi:hypothetical protein
MAAATEGLPARQQFGVLEFEFLHRHGKCGGHRASFEEIRHDLMYAF